MADRHLAMLPKLLIGLAVLWLGVVFTLDNVGVIEAGAVLRFWPLFLVVIGLASLLSGRFLPALLWIAAGVLFLLRSLEVIRFDPIDLWPLVLVAIGAKLITRALFVRQQASAASEDYLTGTAFWTGLQRRTRSPAFRGGDFNAVMGGVEIDLRQSAPAPGATLDLFVFWGGVEIRVPRGWTIDQQLTIVAGGVEDKTVAPETRDKVLTLRGMVVMGGVELIN